MKKKICFITAQPGTARSFLKQPIARLRDDFEIHYVGNFNNVEEVIDLGVDKVFSLPIEKKLSPIQDIKALWLLYRHFRRERYFSVHAITRKATLLTGIASFFAKVPHRIKTFTGQIWVTMKGPKRDFYKMLDKLDILLNTEVLVDGRPQKDFMVENGIINSNQAQVLANGSICGIDTKKFAPCEDIRGARRKELGLKDADIAFLFLGRLKRDKGIYELLDAFDKFVENHPDAKLILVGNDEEDCASKLPEYKNIIAGKNTIVYGMTRHPEELLQAGDIYVLPTYREGFGLAVLEASCLGLPVITSDTYGVRDTMVEGITGLQCKTADSESLLNAMITLYEDPSLCKRMGEAGRQRVIKDFSRELVVEAWYDFYKELK